MSSPTVLTIAGSDSSGGAGAQADLKTIAALGLHGASVLTAVTAQNTSGVRAWEPVSTPLVREQMRAVLEDLDVAAAKTGMLGSPEVVRAVAEELSNHPVRTLVCDPVLVSTSGHDLFSGDVAEAFCTELFPLATLVTPNVEEAQALTGVVVRTVGDAEEAGRQLLARGASAALVTGGHLTESPATDVLVTGEGVRRLEGVWVECESTHGTGCVISSAIAAHLAQGFALEEAVVRSKRFVTRALAQGLAIGKGQRAVNPMAGIATPVLPPSPPG